MTHERALLLAMGFATFLNFVAVLFVSIPSIIRDIRNRRADQRVRVSIMAYEKELLQRGVTLPARCVDCCQILPRHVDGCCFADMYPEKMGTVVERLTRPPKDVQ